jgi:hypothetical protein
MLKMLRRKNKAKKPVEPKEPKAPRKRRRVTRKHVIVSCTGIAALITAVAALIAAFGGAPSKAGAQDPEPPIHRNRTVTAEVTWLQGAPLRWGPGEKTDVKANMPLGAKIKVKDGTCRKQQVVGEMQGQWCQVMYEQDGKSLPGWTFDAYFRREEEEQ